MKPAPCGRPARTPLSRYRYRWYRIGRLAFYYGNRSRKSYGWHWFRASRLGGHSAAAGPFFLVWHTTKAR